MRSTMTDSHHGVIELHGARVSALARSLAHQPTTAQLITYGHLAPPSDGDLARWLSALADHGFTAVRTGALYGDAEPVFRAHGFVPVQRLALLEATRPSRQHGPRHPTKAMRRNQLPAVAALDTAAFPEGWGLDEATLGDVCGATPAFRARVVIDGGELVAHAITGRDNRLGFLQRVAVHPGSQRHGHAAGLVADALRWLARWRVTRVLVNTAVDNDAALGLYAANGFVRLNETLLVAERPL